MTGTQKEAGDKRPDLSPYDAVESVLTSASDDKGDWDHGNWSSGPNAICQERRMVPSNIKGFVSRAGLLARKKTDLL